MKVTETNFLKFLQQPNLFIISINQRTYSWVHQAFDKHSEQGDG